MIEEIFPINSDTMITDFKNPLDSVLISPGYEVIKNDNLSLNMRKNIPSLKKDRASMEERSHFLADIKAFSEEVNVEKFFSLFFESSQKASLFKSLNELSYKFIFLAEDSFSHAITMFRSMLDEGFDQAKHTNSYEKYLPEPKQLYDLSFKKQDFSKIFLLGPSADTENTTSYKKFDYYKDPGIIQKHKLEQFEHFFKLNENKIKKIICYFSHETFKKKVDFILENYPQLRSLIEYKNGSFPQSYYSELDRCLIISEEYIYKKIRKKKIKKINKDVDLYAEQIATLKIGDFIIHKTHGVGKYLGMEHLEFDPTNSDYLVIEYKNQDKIYLPVYKIDLIQKHGESNSSVQIADLRKASFLDAKNKAKKSAKKLAFSLIALQAEREIHKGHAFSAPGELFDEFENYFPFDETDDQLISINKVLEDMQNERPMDRLVCGDVGFGKTEIAMRAAFAAISDQKQVCFLCPTTVLCLQHFKTLQERFKNFPVNIDFLSRLKKAPESKQTIEKIKTGQIDIIVGTHKLLGKDIEFADLGLVIIDEEHRFGVAHKERLKLYKARTDFLTLTATPIPRTLQTAFLGIKDLSVLQTAPPNRQAINTNIIRDNNDTIAKAIKFELSRGGQIFYVHNRVQDIEEMSFKLKTLVPKARIGIAHGQMKETQLEKIILDFFAHEYDILLSTTIIESGLDIPNANTIIINQAQRFGLAQLHQLRGRVGRSSRQGFAYLIIPEKNKLSDIASKRLDAIRNFCELGSGFNIASADLDIRGAGDILGPDQSGHIDKVGLEVYTELLEEAVQEIKGETVRRNIDVEIKTPFPSFIPKQYIEEPALRLKYYKKFSNLDTEEKIKNLENEVKNIFGNLPKETENLVTLLNCRIKARRIGISKIMLNENFIELEFDQHFVQDRPEFQIKLIDYFAKMPKLYKISPDFKVKFHLKFTYTLLDLFSYIENLSHQIAPN
jgi:transcription-repair coupling factor (superfamily II helicase)